jgi:hypothetical protein
VPPKLLVVLSTDGEKPLKIVDPAAGNAELLTLNHFLDIVAYLRHQEYFAGEGSHVIVDSGRR